MKTPDETHPISLAAAPGGVRVLFAGREIANSDDVLVLQEADYPPAYYFPRNDVRMSLLRRTDKSTHCPYKGQASYFTICKDGRVAEDAAWSYETPHPALAAIAGRVAFYPEHVAFQRDDAPPAKTAAVDIGEVIRHTDSGSGAAQSEHWPSNVAMPGRDIGSA
jgi:uncharacterized protein (DUF427 family)